MAVLFPSPEEGAQGAAGSPLTCLVMLTDTLYLAGY
jgi:hypothetical protein